MNNKVTINKRNICFFSIIFLFMIVIGICFFSVPVYAYTTSADGDWTYFESYDGTITVSNYNGEDETVTVPAEIDGYSVGMLSNAFSFNYTVKSITISEGIKSLYQTFYSCTGLETVNLPESIENIYSSTFYNCSSLNELKLGKNVNGFSGDNFYNMNLETFSVDEDNPYFSTDGVLLFDKEKTKVFAAPVKDLTAYSIPDSVIEIGEYGLMYVKLGNDTLPNSLVSIAENGLYCAGPTDFSLTLPSGIESVGNSSFILSKFNSIKFGKNVQEIGTNIFAYCDRLEEIVIDEENPYFCTDGIAILNKDKSVLYDVRKDSIESYDIPEGVTIIKENTFSNSDYKDITIPDGVETIEGYAFSNMSNLTSITFPNSVISLGDSVLYYCQNLVDVTLPSGISEIPYGFMEYCDKIESIQIPSGVTLIDGFAFDGCTSLVDISLPDTLITIKNYAFRHCTGLSSITIPESVESIGSDTFSGCSESLVLNVTEGSYAETFAKDNGLSYSYVGSEECDHTWDSGKVTKEATTSSTGIMTYTCTKCGATKTEVIPALDDEGGEEEEVEEDTSDFTFLELSDGTYQMTGYTGKESRIFIPATYNGKAVTSIGSSAFYGCKNINMISIPSSVNDIEDGALYYGSEFEWISVDNDNLYFLSIDGILYNDDMTILYACPANAVDESYDIPYGVTTIKSNAFSNCISLETVTIPKTVYRIGASAFADCEELMKIRIPEEVTYIGTSAFDGCDNLSLEVYEDSYAENYADRNDLLYSYVREYVSGDYTYELKDDDTIVITAYIGEDENVIIPEEIDDYVVSEIGERAFSDNSDLNSVTVGDNVTVIGNGAFADCENLSYVRFEGDYVTFGEGVFDGSDDVEVIANEGSDAWEYADDEDVVVHECNHVWDEGYVIVEATTQNEGVIVYTCGICGETKKEPIPKLAHTVHTWDGGVVTTAATENSEGVMTYTCTECGAIRTEIIPKLAHTVHTWGAGVITVAATTASEGVMTYTCTVCGETRNESIPRLSEVNDTTTNYVVVEKQVDKEVEKQVYVTVEEQNVKRGSQMNINGIIYTITSIDKCTVECTGLENGNLTEVDIRNVQLNINKDVYKISSIADNAFLNNKSISKIDMGNIETIGENAFKGCQSGLKINLSNNSKLKSVGKGAFGSISTKNITYPKSKKLKAQYQKLVSGSKKALTSISDKGIYQVLNGKKKTVTYISGVDSSAKSVTIPATVTLSGTKYTVTVVGKGALKNYQKMSKLRLGKNIEKVDKDAITGCVRLDTLTIDSKKLKTFSKSTIRKVNGKGLSVNPPSGKKDKYYKMLSKNLKVTKK